MKSGDLKLGTKYAVIPSWDYSSADKKNPLTVDRRSVAPAELVNLDKYEYKVFRFDSPDNPNFQPAPKGARSVGYLVKSEHWAGGGSGTVYWLARPQDIVAEYATLETRWNEQEHEELERRAKERAEQEEREQRQKNQLNNEQRKLQAIQLALKTIIGDRANNVKFDINNRRDSNGNYVPQGEVTFDLRTMEVMVEKILEARDSGY